MSSSCVSEYGESHLRFSTPGATLVQAFLLEILFVQTRGCG